MVRFPLESDSGLSRPGESAKETERMNAEMERLGPICCYLGDERVVALYANWAASPPRLPENEYEGA